MSDERVPSEIPDYESESVPYKPEGRHARGSKQDPGALAQFTPPSAIDAEQSVIGALLLDNNAWDRVADRLSPRDFYKKSHRLLFEGIQQLFHRQQPVDVLTLTETLKTQGFLDQVGGEHYLFTLAQNTPTAANVVAYADIVREKAVLRQLITAGSDIVTQACAQSQDIRTMLDRAEQTICHISQQRARGSGPLDMGSLLATTMERLHILQSTEGHLTGLGSGFLDLDKMTAGLQAADLVIVAARPSMGKTIFGMNMAQHAAIKSTNKPVLVFSLEMPAESIVMRLISDLASVNQQKVRTGQLSDDDWGRVTGAVGQLAEAQLYIDDTPALSPTEVRSRARRLAREHDGLSLIVLDYLQLMEIEGTTENRTNEVSKISRSLKALAKELNCPVVALSQLNRSLEQRHDKRPVMSDLRESGAIEQDADLILFLYRDEVYNEDSPHKGIAEVIIGKHRNGEIGKIRLSFQGQYMRFGNLSNQEAPAGPAVRSVGQFGVGSL